MSAVVAALVGLVAGAATAGIWHVHRSWTLVDDLSTWRTARQAPAVHQPDSTGITPDRDVYRAAHRESRRRRRLERENARLRAVADVLYDRLTDRPPRRPGGRPRPVERRRLSWRDRVRWIKPWPVAAITHRSPS